MKTKQKTLSSYDKKKTIHKAILSLLDEGNMTKTEIFELIQGKYEINNSYIRSIVKEIKSDYLSKLHVLQSGMVKL